MFIMLLYLEEFDIYCFKLKATLSHYSGTICDQSNYEIIQTLLIFHHERQRENSIIR